VSEVNRGWKWDWFVSDGLAVRQVTHGCINISSNCRAVSGDIDGFDFAVFTFVSYRAFVEVFFAWAVTGLSGDPEEVGFKVNEIASDVANISTTY
jgi:hypothetical protein